MLNTKRRMVPVHQPLTPTTASQCGTTLLIRWAGEALGATGSGVIVHRKSGGFAVWGVGSTIAAQNDSPEATIEKLTFRVVIRSNRPHIFGIVVSGLAVEDKSSCLARSCTSTRSRRWCTTRPLPNFSILERSDVAWVDADSIIDARSPRWNSRRIVKEKLDGIATFVRVLI